MDQRDSLKCAVNFVYCLRGQVLTEFPFLRPDPGHGRAAQRRPSYQKVQSSGSRKKRLGWRSMRKPRSKNSLSL